MISKANHSPSVSRSHRSPLVCLIAGVIALQGTLLAGSLRFLPWDDSVSARQIALLGKSSIELEDLHPGKRSKAYPAGEGETAPKLVALDRSNPDGKPVTIDIKVDPKFQTPLVLIIPDPKHPTGLRPFVVEDDSSNFSWGSVRILNATGKELMIRQEKIIKALPKSWTPVDIAQAGKARNVGVQVAARDKPKDILYSAVWEHSPDVRKLVFIVPGADARTGSVECKIIPQDRRVVAAEKSDAATTKAP